MSDGTLPEHPARAEVVYVRRTLRRLAVQMRDTSEEWVRVLEEVDADLTRLANRLASRKARGGSDRTGMGDLGEPDAGLEAAAKARCAAAGVAFERLVGARRSQGLARLRRSIILELSDKGATTVAIGAVLRRDHSTISTQRTKALAERNGGT